MNHILVLGNQLFAIEHLKGKFSKGSEIEVFMKEDFELCTYYKFHKQKIIFFLAAMRNYSEELHRADVSVHYEKLEERRRQISFEESFSAYVQKKRIKKIFLFEIEDKFFEKRLVALFSKLSIEHEFWNSPMFLTSRDNLKKRLAGSKRPFMKTFYEEQRKQLRILVDANLKPVGGQWSFDAENRKALPVKIIPPPLPSAKESKIVSDVSALCLKHFSDHPGELAPFWLPVDRVGARAWLDSFIKERLREFGPYEDAIPAHSDFLFHSVLSPFLNTGLLTPDEVVAEVIKQAKKSKAELPSIEGFIRQVIGWREFIRGIYQNFSDRQENTNFWNHKTKLSSVWYEGASGIPVLDRAIDRVNRHGYLHHIERLMVVGSLMVLLEVDPKEAHRWFMEMFIDSSDWVMGPNVYGMAIFSDGGIFATKPYICGSNYYLKMSGEKKADWCDGVDGLYWGFIEKHEDFFIKNPRLSMMARALKKIDPVRLKKIKLAAKELRSRLVVEST